MYLLTWLQSVYRDIVALLWLRRILLTERFFFFLFRNDTKEDVFVHQVSLISNSIIILLFKKKKGCMP